MQCLHIYSDGKQCPMPAMEASEFCVSHLPVPHSEDAPIQLPLFFRFIRRLGAAVLLGLFLLQLYVWLRAMYAGN